MSIGVHNGYQLETLSGFRKAVELLRRLKPRYLHVSPPCDPWTAFHCNQRIEEQRRRLGEKRTVSKKLLRNCRRLVEIQVQELNGECGLVPDSVPGSPETPCGG